VPKRIHAHRRARFAAKGGALGGNVDDARRIDVAVGGAAGPAGKLDALGVVGIGGEEAREAVAELANGGNSPEANLVARTRADRGADGALVVVDILRTDSEFHRPEEIIDREIAQQIGGEDGDGVREVGEFPIGAGAGHRGGSGIALVVTGVYLKRGEDDGLIFSARKRGRGSSRGRRERLGVQGGGYAQRSDRRSEAVVHRLGVVSGCCGRRRWANQSGGWNDGLFEAPGSGSLNPSLFRSPSVHFRLTVALSIFYSVVIVIVIVAVVVSSRLVSSRLVIALAPTAIAAGSMQRPNFF